MNSTILSPLTMKKKKKNEKNPEYIWINIVLVLNKSEKSWEYEPKNQWISRENSSRDNGLCKLWIINKENENNWKPLSGIFKKVNYPKQNVFSFW